MTAQWKVNRLNVTEHVDADPKDIARATERAREKADREERATERAVEREQKRKKFLCDYLRMHAHCQVWKNGDRDRLVTLDALIDDYGVITAWDMREYRYAANVKRMQPSRYARKDTPQTILFILRNGYDRIA